MIEFDQDRTIEAAIQQVTYLKFTKINKWGSYSIYSKNHPENHHKKTDKKDQQTGRELKIYAYPLLAQLQYDVNIMGVFKVAFELDDMFIIQFTVDADFLSHLDKANNHFRLRKEESQICFTSDFIKNP